eukprot:331286_1
MASSQRQEDSEKNQIIEFSKKLGISKAKAKQWVKNHWEQCLLTHRTMASSQRQEDSEKNQIIEFSKKLGISKAKAKQWVKNHWEQCLLSQDHTGN